MFPLCTRIASWQILNYLKKKVMSLSLLDVRYWVWPVRMTSIGSIIGGTERESMSHGNRVCSCRVAHSLSLSLSLSDPGTKWSKRSSRSLNGKLIIDCIEEPGTDRCTRDREPKGGRAAHRVRQKGQTSEKRRDVKVLTSGVATRQNPRIIERTLHEAPFSFFFPFFFFFFFLYIYIYL